MESSELISTLHSELNARRFSNGWQLTPGRSIEPLCFRILALRRDARELEHTLLLERLQQKDGAWPAVFGDEEPCAWTTALAVFALMTMGRKARLRRAVDWLIDSKGREASWFWRWKFRNIDTEVRFDPAKYGWAWVPATTSWVVPTAMSIIALEKVRQAGIVAAYAINERIKMGIAMLLDRMCPGGGWNSGNGIAFGVALDPYIDATAIAVLALQQYQHEAVIASLSRLISGLAECPSPYSIAWGILALTLHRHRINQGDPLRVALGRLIAATAADRSTLDMVTLSICALALAAADGDNVFAVPV